MEMRNDCPDTFSHELSLPKTISGLNIWPPKDPNVTTRDIYSASNRGHRRGNFVVNPEWISEDKSDPPKTIRTIGRVYEPNAVDFHGARDLHAKTWEQARIYPEHGTNPHLALPGYAPFKYEPLHYREGKQEIADSWPYNQFQTVADPLDSQPSVPVRARTAAGTYYTHVPEDNSQYTRELNDLHAVHVHDKMTSGKPDIETREFTRSNREILYGYNRAIPNGSEYAEKVILPQPYGTGGHREITDLFANTYSRNLPQMLFRKAQHAHAPWHAYMSFCDWGEAPRQAKPVA